jgi:hypothetical protein
VRDPASAGNAKHMFKDTGRVSRLRFREVALRNTLRLNEQDKELDVKNMAEMIAQLAIDERIVSLISFLNSPGLTDDSMKITLANQVLP